MSYDPSTTAILLVDPYNDFLSEGGKLWPWVKDMAEQNKLNQTVGGKELEQRLKDVGYVFTVSAQLLGMAPDASALINQWKNSPDALKLLAEVRCDEIGIGASRPAGSNSTYWSVILGARQNQGAPQ